MIKIILLILILYILPTIYNILWIRKAYNKNGRWYGILPTMEDLFFCFCPIINIIISISMLINTPYNTTKNKNLNKNLNKSLDEKLAEKLFLKSNKN